VIRPRLAVDTAPWISWFEKDPRFEEALAEIFRGVIEGQELAVVSTLALLEVLTGAHRRRDLALARRYEDLFLHTTGIVVLPVDAAIAAEAARIRVRYALTTADAIHVATALVAGAPIFLTTDRRLSRVRELDVRVIAAKGGPKRKR
jgi:predicted nucleic acid-binding protein